MYATMSMTRDDYQPIVTVTRTNLQPVVSDQKMCILPVSNSEVIVADREGKISRIKAIGEKNCSQVEVSDNNSGKPIADFVRSKDDKIFYIDTDKSQLKESIGKRQSQSILQNVWANPGSSGKLLKYYERKNQIYVRGQENNSILVYSLEHGSIEQEFIIKEINKSSSICAFSVNPKNGDLIAVSDNGDIFFRGTNPARPDAFYKFTGRENEKFAAVAVDWEANLLIAVGTQSVENQNYRHMMYIYCMKDTNQVKFITHSDIWETKGSNSADLVSYVFLQEVRGRQFICCFTEVTSSLYVFQYSPSLQAIEPVSLPLKLSQGRVVDVKKAFGNFYACFGDSEIALVTMNQ